MKAIIKVFAIFLGLFFIACAAVIIYASTLNPNDYKSLIAEKFQEETGRTLAIDGDIVITVYPWLGLELNGITVGNARDFGDTAFFHTDHAMLRVKLMPLFRKQYEIDTVRLYGPSLNLVKNADGLTNLDDLLGGSKARRGDASFAAIVLGGVDVRDGSFSWDDQTTGVRYAISNLTINTGELVYGEPIEVNLSMNAVSNIPELNADLTMASTITYDLDNEIYDIAPLNFNTVLSGPNIPQGSTDISLQSNIRINLDDETMTVADLDFTALGTRLTGPINFSNIMDETPSLQTDINLTGDDLALLFKVAEIEPLATQLAAVSERGFNFSAAIQTDMDDGVLEIRGLRANLLGANISAEVNGRKIQSDTPAIEATVKASGPDLPTLLKVMGQLQGGADSSLSIIAEEIRGSANKSFDITAEIGADMGTGDMTISGLRANLLGSNIAADLNGEKMQSDAQAISGTINASGPDLPILLQVMGQLQGADSTLSELATQLRGTANRSFNISTEIDADMGNGNLNITDLQANLLGADIKGDIKASKIKSSSPALAGTLNASGPNLPSLMQLLGQVLGGAESPLSVYGKQFTGITNKAFVIDTRFDADMENGNINLPLLSIDALGLKMNGNLVANNMQGNNGNINGQLALTGNRMGEILAALDHADLAEVLQSMNLSAAINGSRTDMNISPLDLKLVFKNTERPNSTFNMDLAASSRLNLEQETLDLSSFRLSGLDMNLSGNLLAEKIFESPAFKGEVQAAPFNLRRLMLQLNQEPPDTADKTAYESVSLSSTFEGSSGHLNISKLAMVLDQSKINGNVSVTDFDNPAIQFAVDIDQINADRYMSAKEKDQPARPITPETAAGAAAQLPLETLRSLNTRGQLKVGQLVISNARMSDVVLALNAKDGKINLSPVAANLYQGNYKGDIRLDASTDIPALSFDSSLQGVEIDPFMMDFLGASNISGNGNMSMNITAKGIDSTSMISNMNGSGKLALEDGVLQGIDVARVLAQVQIMIETRRPTQIDRGEQTPFDTFTSTLTVNNGVISSNDLAIASPGIKVTGKGTVINLNNNTLNYDLVASADRGTATRGEEQYNIGGYSIPIKCSGNANSPSCIPNVEEIIKVAVQREVQKQIGNVLQRALGVEVPASQPQEPAGTATPAQPPAGTTPPPAQPVDPAQQILNKALEGIFR